MGGNIKKILSLAFCLAITLLSLCGCEQSLSEMNIQRDNYNTGGKVSFSYDASSHTALFGGENEVIQYYEENISKGFIKAGNRVGIKLTPYEEIKDIGSLTFKIGKDEFSGEDVATKVNEKVSFFQLFPFVEEAGQTIEICVDYKGQKSVYYIKIHEKSILMDKSS